MPQLTLTVWLSWLTSIVGQMAVAYILAQTGLRRRFRSVFAFLCWRSVISLVLLSITLYAPRPARTWWYFWVYYFGVAIASILKFWLIINLSTLLVSSPEMRFAISVGLKYMGAAYVLGSGLFSFLSPLPFDEGVVKLSVAFNRATSLAWLAVFLTVALITRQFRITWPKDAQGIAIGFALLSIGDVGTAWLMGVLPHWSPLAYIDATAYIACLAAWTLTLCYASGNLAPTRRHPVIEPHVLYGDIAE